jgi:hypothetical protein
MRPNRVFFPQPLLDAWVADERVDITGTALQLRDEGRSYEISEAVHVLRDAAGGGDANKLLGKVKTREQLMAIGAEVFEGSMIVGDDAYDVIPGFVGTPVGAPVDTAPNAEAGEEDLLAQFLIKSL